MATLEEAIAIDIARKILDMNEIKQGLELRREWLKEQSGRGLK